MKLRTIVPWLLSAIALLLVFAAYLRPDVVVTLANQLWSCF